MITLPNNQSRSVGFLVLGVPSVAALRQAIEQRPHRLHNNAITRESQDAEAKDYSYVEVLEAARHGRVGAVDVLVLVHVEEADGGILAASELRACNNKVNNN